ncbi:MAG: citramalate synthase [Clostridium beijerinckii]|jgi:2-isopropylmalate synthase|uniref:citramalate synthase n=1 Tax=Clostridium beijerinckii TaxID=1520 RepID=UPI00242DEC6C|nr:citramalate synthase [Clostridium beijerinckii]MCI1478164.1 citramalate synthase [Clostridium beijerinckii]MCI1578535.1 citramalate synthase [Clostridium beijerinckii]MCI1584234.1 citramalate synthase [Clostridium beijerinckii]MCI1621983.1 citramalate synthase [Clostridium beijerinckii]MDG5856730.1 citramalate synthase [Clostridium beijerinckii]
MAQNQVKIFDSTLRDGAQGQGISFSLEDKIKIVKVLDEMKVDYIEAGNPGSNPKDMEFFKRLKDVELKNAKVAAFGSTRRPKINVEDDKNLKDLLSSGADTIVVFGKSWDFQVTDIIKTSLSENVNMIKETIEYLCVKGKEVIFDAEHFYDGYKANKEYAMATLKAAEEAGAKVVVLCDTNGGTLPQEIYSITKSIKETVKVELGIHSHDDMGMAVANSIMAVEAGASQIQGTFIGIGERCGNANLSTIIPTLKLKLGYKVLNDNELVNLTKTSRYIAEICNITLSDEDPFVGNSAFAHKGGMHIDAVTKSPKSYEHIEPESVGNKRRFLVSEVSGKSTILQEIQKIFPNISKNDKSVQKITDRLKELEYDGYQFEGAEGTVELVIRKIIGKYKPFFKLNHFKIIGEQPYGSEDFSSTAVINITVDGQNEMTAAEGEGPVNALDKAIRKALEVFYPELKQARLVDYKVRVLDSESATEAKVRVLIESTDGIESWSTVGVSRDVIQASWIALVDSIEYKLIKDIERKVKAYF